MSFSSTPLGQGRRLDHHTFLNRNPNSTANPRPPASPPPVSSYSYGAPSLGARSPPKPSSPTRTHRTLNNDSSNEEPALARFARLKQQQQTQARSSGPQLITQPPDPERERWSVKDTTVNIASAFHQAAANSFDTTAAGSSSLDTSGNTSGSVMQPHNPNTAWASGSTRPSQVPRSTSVEYEADSQTLAARARLAARSRRPLSKNASTHTVPDSEAEDQENRNRSMVEREKSPFDAVVDVSKRALSQAAFYLRQRQDDGPATNGNHSTTNGKEDSYSYSAEEREYELSQRQSATKPSSSTSQSHSASQKSRPPPVSSANAHRKNRMSVDNKAYVPTASDIEDEAYDDDIGGDGPRRRRKAKKGGPQGGPLQHLPKLGYDKRKRRRSRGNAGEMGLDGEEGGSGEEESEEEGDSTEQRSAHQRASVPRSRSGAPSRSNANPPFETTDDSIDFLETGLHSIPEVNESEPPPLVDGLNPPKSTSSTSSPLLKRKPMSSRSPVPFSIGALLGRLVHHILSLMFQLCSLLVWVLSMFMFLLGSISGTIFDILFSRPARLLASPGPVRQLGKYLVVAGCVYAAWYALRDPIRQYIPAMPIPRLGAPAAGPEYTAPELPAADVVALSARLQALESALAAVSRDTRAAAAQAEREQRARGDLAGRLGNLEGRVGREAARVQDVEREARRGAERGVGEVRREVEVLRAEVKQREREWEREREARVHVPVEVEREREAEDEEARARLRVLEERLGDIETDVKDALEIGRNAAKAVASAPAPSAGPAWWNKLTGSDASPGLTIKSADGQDVSALLSALVDARISLRGKDYLARADFAAYAGGASVVPSLTSPTFELRPHSVRGHVVALLTGSGYGIGRPPVTALSPDLHNGHCWPFVGRTGQLGVALAHPVVVDAVTVDHVAREVAFNMQSAPREMEVWGMVEGQDNVEKVRAWDEARRLRRAEAEAAGVAPAPADEDPPHPPTLPKAPRYVRLAQFSYDIDAPSNVQSFPVSQDIQDLGVDFGVVVLLIKDNWGMDEYTCLYRFRVHGEKVGANPPSEEEVPLEVPSSSS